MNFQNQKFSWTHLPSICNSIKIKIRNRLIKYLRLQGRNINPLSKNDNKFRAIKIYRCETNLKILDLRKKILSLPIHPFMSKKEILYVSESINLFFDKINKWYENFVFNWYFNDNLDYQENRLIKLKKMVMMFV